MAKSIPKKPSAGAPWFARLFRTANPSAAASTKSLTQARETHRPESLQRIIDKSKHHDESGKTGLALRVINQAIESGNTSPKLLLEKAVLLSKQNRFGEAHGILKALIKLEGEEELTAVASQARKASKIIQNKELEIRQHLVGRLHKLAKTHHASLDILPKPNQLNAKQDLLLLVRKEAEHARSNGATRLSLDLLDAALTEGLQSPWLLHLKAKSLCAIGDFNQAEVIWNELIKSQNRSKLNETINESLNNLASEKKNFLSKRPKKLIASCRKLALSAGWSVQHLPKPETIQPKTNTQKMVIEEAIAARKAGNSQLSLDLLNKIFDFYESNTRALLQKAEALATLDRISEAFEIWTQLLSIDNEKTADTAQKSLSKWITDQALKKSISESPEEATAYFINQFVNIGKLPEFNNKVLAIMNGSQPPKPEISRKELRLQKMKSQIKFNNAVMDILQARS